MNKPKKDINIKLDGKNVDVNIIRNDGITTIEIDSDKLDALIEKSAKGIDIKISDSTGMLSKLLKLFGLLKRKR
jgi:hypothetical protein